MSTSTYTKTIIFISVISLLTSMMSCTNSNQSSENTEVDPYAGKTLDEIVQMKDSIYQILSKSDDGFYYVNTTDSLFFFDYPNKKEVLVFTPGSSANISKINLNTIKLEITDDGTVQFTKRRESVHSSYTYQLFKNLVRQARMASYFDSPHFFGKDGFIIEVPYEFGSYNFDIYYLVKPLGDGNVEAILLPFGTKCESQIVFEDPLKIHLEAEFDLNDLPETLKPTFDNRLMTSGLITNPLFKFYYGAIVKIDGTIIQDENVDFGHLDYEMDKNLFKDKQALKTYLNGFEPNVTSAMRKNFEEFAIDHASSLQYFVDCTKNKNEINNMYGKTYYMTAIVNEVSEKNDYDGKYKVRFGDQQLNSIGSIWGYTTDDNFANLHLPVRVILKVTIADDIIFSNFFKEMEIVR